MTCPGGRGFVTYRDLGDADAGTVRRLARAALGHYRADPAVARVKWKTRGHDRAPGQHDALVGDGFVPHDPGPIPMDGASAPAVDVPLPGEVPPRRVSSEPDAATAS